MSDAQMVNISNDAADVLRLPRLLVLGALCAESTLNPDARRPADPANDPTSWPDVSFGLGQQTVRWAAEYAGGAAYPGEAEIERVGAFYLVPEYAAAVAAKQLGAHYNPSEDDAIFKAMCRYNWPAGNGVPKNATVAKNYRDGIARAFVLLAGDTPVPTPGITFEAYTDPQPAGTFSVMPKGVILHGSRSTVTGNPKATEYKGTANYEVSNAAGLGWNATIGESIVAVHLPAQEWGWNARDCSETYLAVEFAQATVDEPITDPQVDAFVAWFQRDVLPIWPNLPLNFPTHAELDGTAEYGTYDGKSDIFPKGDKRADDLRSRIMTKLNAMPAPAPAPSTYAVGPGVLAAMAAHTDAPATDEMYYPIGAAKSQYSETFGRSGSRYVYLFATNETHRFDPTA